MGCDIHIVVESRDPRDQSGAWTKHDEPESMGHRWYGAFAALAGVRQRIPTVERVIPKNRGIPKDFVWPPGDMHPDDTEELPYTLEEFSNDDGHSHNWLWLYELDRYAHRKFSEDEADLRDWFVEAVKWMRTLGASDDVRMVFFFDN